MGGELYIRAVMHKLTTCAPCISKTPKRTIVTIWRKKEMHDQGGISLFLQESVSNSRVLTSNAALQPQQRKRRWGDARCRLFFHAHRIMCALVEVRARAVSPYIYLTTYRHAQCSQQQHQLHCVARNGWCCKIFTVDLKHRILKYKSTFKWLILINLNDSKKVLKKLQK